jgi:hypothetical protein
VGRAAAGVFRASDLHGSARGVPVEVPRGSGGSGDHRRQGIARAGHLTCGGSRSNSGHGRTRGQGWKAPKLPGSEAELLRVLAGARVRRSGLSTVGPRALRVRVSGARVWGGCGVGDEVQGVHGSQIKAGPGVSACGPSARAHRRFQAAGARGGRKKERRGRR